MKKCYGLAMSILLAGFSLLAQAHPHHAEHASDHIHFSVASFSLVAFMLVGYWVFSRYLRGRDHEQSEKVRKEDKR
ncbi:hypothetical protein [Gilvimarinus chinensis]|uniref:hypothetical protein n=1 Tax=Gilvimarinus chinensis TaxID=396005 RepID=UPI00037D2960|nr:hypothetical protein [Gilvimarinus chinensis]